MTKGKSAGAKAADERFLKHLRWKVRRAARELSVCAPSFTRGKGKTFEAWVMFEIAAHLKATRSVVAKNSRGKRVKHFRIRGGPGYIPSCAGPPNKKPCYFEIEPRVLRDSVQLHNSLEHRGHSGVEHELDLSIVPTNCAERFSYFPGGSPYWGPILFGAELKAHIGEVSKAVARGVLGIALDIPRNRDVVARGYWHNGELHHSDIAYPLTRLHLVTSSAQHADCLALLTSFECKGVPAASPALPGSLTPLLHDIERQLF